MQHKVASYAPCDQIEGIDINQFSRSHITSYAIKLGISQSSTFPSKRPEYADVMKEVAHCTWPNHPRCQAHKISVIVRIPSF